MASLMKLLLEMTVTASLMVGIVLLIRKFLSKSMNAVVMLLLWGLVLFRFLLPFTLSSPVSLADLMPEPSPSAMTSEVAKAQPDTAFRAAEGSAHSAATAFQAAAQQPSEITRESSISDTAAATFSDLLKNISLWSALGAAWAAGAVAVLFLFMRKARGFRKKLCVCKAVSDDNILEAIHLHKKELGLRKKISVLECDFVHAPAVFGYFKPCILIPSKFIGKMNKDSLSAILLHEICHIRRHDILVNYIWLIAKALHWFNPLVWIAYKRFADDVELCRDQEAARKLDTDGAFVYSRSLVEAALFLKQTTASVPSLATSIVESKSKLKVRVKRLMKPHRKTKSSVVVSALLALLMIVACFTTACQPTPEKEAVAGKGGLQDELFNSAPAQMESTQDRWQYEKEYDSGNRLMVDAVMVHTDAGQLPVLSVAPKGFESGEQLKTITSIFCPAAVVYDQGDQLTKQQLEQAIMEVKEQIFKVENDMIPFEGAAEPIPQDRKEEYLKNLEGVIQYYNEQIETAPDDSELKEASYQLVDVGDGSLQSNMLATANDAALSIGFVNWPPDIIGSLFYFESNKMVLENIGTSDELIIPESLKDDGEFVKAKERIDQCVRDMGIDYMSLGAVSKGKNSYSFYYTRSYGGLHETYVNRHVGTTVTGVDGAPVIYLWKPEYLWIIVQNDQIVKVTWNNPSEIIAVDNENVATKPWEEIQEIFKKQMDYLMSPNPSGNADPSNSTYFFEKTDVYINRVELGLTKLLMKDSKDDYKLVPTWSFLGYESSPSYPAKEGVNMGGEVCYLTINAIDGTVVDRGLMY